MTKKPSVTNTIKNIGMIDANPAFFKKKHHG
jgi:hypothetical protein